MARAIFLSVINLQILLLDLISTDNFLVSTFYLKALVSSQVTEHVTEFKSQM